MRTPFEISTRALTRVHKFAPLLLLTALVLVTVYQLIPLIEFVPRSIGYFAQPREFHLARRWQADNYFAVTQSIKAQTPPDALIVLPDMRAPFGRLGNPGLTDYMLFPRQTANARDRQIESFPGPLYQIIPDSETGNISLVPVRARQANIVLPERDFVLLPRRVEIIALAIVKFLLVVLSGAFWVRKFFQLTTTPGDLAASALLGMTLNAMLFIFLSLLNLPARELLQYAILVLLALPALVNLARRRPRVTLPRTRAESLAAIAAIGALALILFLGISKPLMEWDALAIWGIKARVIFATETLRTLGMWGAYPEYPPLVPVAMAQLGIGGELAVKALFPIVAWCLYGVVYEGLEWSGWMRWLAPLPLLYAPQIGEQSGNGYANLALAVYVTLAVILLARWVKQPTRALALATALTLTGLVLVRPEGEIYALYVLLLVAFVIWKKRAPKHDALLFALPLLADAAWKLFFTLHLKAASGSAFGVASQGQQFFKYLLTTRPPRGSLLPVMQTLLQYSFGLNFWGLLPLAFVGMVALRPRTFYTRYAVELAFLILSGAGLALLALYLAPRWGIDYFFNATYLRFYMAVVPLMYLLTLNVAAAEYSVWKRYETLRVVSA
jgi:hypothetical protein